MPLYDFECPCGCNFEEFADVVEIFSECPQCGEDADRIISFSNYKSDSYLRGGHVQDEHPAWLFSGKTPEDAGFDHIVNDPDEVAAGRQKKIECRSDLNKRLKELGLVQSG